MRPFPPSLLAIWVRASLPSGRVDADIGPDGPGEISACVDIRGGFNSNHPDGHRSFLPGTGTTAKRANELGLNLAGVDVALTDRGFRGRATFVVGSGTDVLHAGEPTGSRPLDRDQTLVLFGAVLQL